RRCYPEALHPKTLVLVARHSSWYTDMLSADERRCLAKAGQLTVSKLESYGYGALEIGSGYCAADYADSEHLSESGGAKMSREVAQKLLTMAKSLGYLEEEQ